jgi:hypothetical protein
VVKGLPCPSILYGFEECGYYVDRAYSIIPLLRLDPTLIDEVWKVLDAAREKTEPHYARRRANIEMYYAEASFYTGNYTGAISAALESLDLSHSVSSMRNIKRIQQLYNKLTQTKIRDSAELRELRDALKK